jgi:hypothetical protein
MSLFTDDCIGKAWECYDGNWLEIFIIVGIVGIALAIVFFFLDRKEKKKEEEL